MLRVISLIFVTLALGVAVILLEGSRLPVKHIATRSIVVPAAPESVYATISDVARAAEWRPDVERVELVPNSAGRIRFTEIGSGDVLSMEVEEAIPPRRFVTRIIGEGLPFGGAWAFAIAADGSGSRVTITEHGEIHNVLFRFVARYILGYTTTLDRYLSALGVRYHSDRQPEDGLFVPLTQ